MPPLLKTTCANYCLALLLFAGRALAGTPDSSPLWLDQTWQTDDGLPDNNVTGIAQSPEGYLWVATLGGLMRFNGSRFEDFSKEFSQQRIPNVQNRVVRRMLLDRSARLWLVMERGEIICASQKDIHVFTHFAGLQHQRITVMTEDKDNAIWLAGGRSIYRIKDEQVTDYHAENGLPAGNYSWVATDGQGTLWFTHGTHLGVWQGGEWKTRLTLDNPPIRIVAAKKGGMWVCTATELLFLRTSGELIKCGRLPEKISISALGEDQTGALWIGTETDGLLRWQGAGFDHVPTSHPEISCLTEDHAGNLWVGTGGGGLNLLRSQAMHLLGKKEGLPGESVRSICQETNGELWVVMNNGSLAHGLEDQWHKVTAADGWPGGSASCVTGSRDGGVWVGTRDRGLQHFCAGKWKEWERADGLDSAGVRSLLLSKSGVLWIAAEHPNQLLRFNNGNFTKLAMPGEVRSLRAMAEGTDGSIWVGCSDGRLFRVANQTLTSETTAQADRLLSIRSLHTTADGSLWIGYAGWGLARLWGEKYVRITTKEGLYDDYISQILSDGQGGMWLTSNHGLFQLREAELTAVTEGRSPRVRAMVYGKNEGLPSIQPTWDNSPTVCRSTENQLWFATRNGLLNVHPGQIQVSPTPPPVQLERVSVDDALAALRDAHSPLRGQAFTNDLDLSAAGIVLRVPPKHRKIEFEFTALNFTSPENIHFRYRLSPFDNAWVEAGNQHSAIYPTLPRGNYELQVQACSHSGLWNEAGASLKLVVMPFFWETWPFRLSVLGGFTAGIAALVRLFSFQRLRRELARLEQQAALQRERTRIARDMHDEVGSKLSRLSLLSAMASQQPGLSPAMRGDTAEISETARETIRSFEEIVWAVNPKNDSLPQLINYLCRFAEEFFEGSTTQCGFEVPAEIPCIELPTGARHHLFLAAKEALNNVFKHAHAKNVWVRLTITGEQFDINIEDNGQGFAPTQAAVGAGSGNGLENMRERMRLAGGELFLASHTGSGTLVTLRLCGAGKQAT